MPITTEQWNKGKVAIEEQDKKILDKVKKPRVRRRYTKFDYTNISNKEWSEEDWTFGIKGQSYPPGPYYCVFKDDGGKIWRLAFPTYQKAMDFTHNPNMNMLNFMGLARKIKLMDEEEYVEYRLYVERCKNKSLKYLSPTEYAFRILKVDFPEDQFEGYCEECISDKPSRALCCECYPEGVPQ